MFDFSIAETSLTLIVALLLIGPEELPGIVRGMRNISRKSKQVLKEINDKIMSMEGAEGLAQEVKKLNEDIKFIADNNGNLHEAYEIDDIMPEIEKARSDRKAQDTTSKTAQP